MNNIQVNNSQGITVHTARILKAGVDQTPYQTPEQKYLEKATITSNISDPIDKEEEAWCDFVDLLADGAKQGIHRAASLAREQRAKAEQEKLIKELSEKIEQFAVKNPQLGSM